MPYYTYFFFLKCHLCVKIQKFSLTDSDREDLINYQMNFSGNTLQNISFFLFLNPKVSLFILNFCHSYYPADLVWNFIFFLTSHCDSFCTWKCPTIPTFYTNSPYFYQMFIHMCSLLFFVEGHIKAWSRSSGFTFLAFKSFYYNYQCYNKQFWCIHIRSKTFWIRILHCSKYLKVHCVFCHWSQYKCTHGLTHTKSWINKTKTCLSCD